MDPVFRPKETRVRRLARCNGLRLIKNCSRTPDAPRVGGYMLVDAEINVVVAGANPVPYCLDLDDVGHWLTSA